MDLYYPSGTSDSDKGAADKVKRLQDFFTSSLQLMQAPGWKPEPLSKINAEAGISNKSDLKKKYGLE